RRAGGGGVSVSRDVVGRLPARRRRGGRRRRPRRLVRGHRDLPPPARAAHPAHRADPGELGGAGRARRRHGRRPRARAELRPAGRATVAEVIDELLTRYRARMGVYPRLWIGLAELLGVLDRERIVTALHSGLREVAKNPDHPLRARASEIVAELETRLTTDGALAARVEAAKNELL